MTDLSPAAQAVLDAFLDTPGEVPMPMWDYGRDLAAALVAVADQVAPFPGRYPMNEYMEGLRDARQNARRELLAIAAELKALDN